MGQQLQLNLSEFEGKFRKLLKEYISGKKVEYTTAEKKIATEISIRLRNKRVVKNVRDYLAKENTEIPLSRAQIEKNLENCSKSLLEIRQFLEDKEVEIGVLNTDSSLFLFIDFALAGILQFLDFDECFSVNHRYTRGYIEAIDKIRSHLLLTAENMDLFKGVAESYGSLSNLIENFNIMPDLLANKKAVKINHSGKSSQETLEFADASLPLLLNEPTTSYANKVQNTSHSFKFKDPKDPAKYVGLLDDLEDLYHSLVRHAFIDSKTTSLPNFKKIFTGNQINTKKRVRWSTADVELKYFINKLYPLLDCGKEKWQITTKCFVNKEGADYIALNINRAKEIEIRVERKNLLDTCINALKHGGNIPLPS